MVIGALALSGILTGKTESRNRLRPELIDNWDRSRGVDCTMVLAELASWS